MRTGQEQSGRRLLGTTVQSGKSAFVAWRHEPRIRRLFARRHAVRQVAKRMRLPRFQTEGGICDACHVNLRGFCFCMLHRLYKGSPFDNWGGGGSVKFREQGKLDEESVTG